MILREVTIDNSVSYVSKVDHSHSKKTQLFAKVNKKMLPILNLHKRIKKPMKI